MAGRILESIVFPTLRGLAAEGRPYRGFLYSGLMITHDGPKVIEFNARMGDPETQVVLPGLAEDLLPHLWNAAGGRIESGTFRTRGRPSRRRRAGVGRIPGAVRDREGDRRPRRSGRAPGHARSSTPARPRATAAIVTAGGRVLTVVGGGRRLRGSARRRAYDGGRDASRLTAMHYRRDIGVRAVDSSQKPVGERREASRLSQ